MRAVMGLEVHVQLLTESKLFCGCSTEHEGRDPNENTCPICLGFPGSKPKVNRRAVEHGIKISRALSCEVQPEIRFSRKSYFYPDMPKNFQISQFEVPLARDGSLLLGERRIGITRVHLPRGGPGEAGPRRRRHHEREVPPDRLQPLGGPPRRDSDGTGHNLPEGGEAVPG
jgi:Asp-tRNA(Asn)/Glu-tRNA(Gln) amidotransferase B subunit